MTEAQFRLAELARIGPYFALLDGSDAGFEPVTALIAETGQGAARLGERIDDASARLGTAQPWIAASMLYQGWAARLTSIYAGSAALDGAIPDLSAASGQNARVRLLWRATLQPRHPVARNGRRANR